MNTATIKARLEQARQVRDEAEGRVRDLEHQLDQARALDQAADRHQQHLRVVLARMSSGEYIAHSATGRPEWFAADGRRIGSASPEEMDAVSQLKTAGLIHSEHTSREVAA